ncbi:multicopper oxidase domain-containing protein [Escherichia coli]
MLTLRPTGLLPLVTDSLPMRLLPTEIMAGSPIRSRDISLGDGPGINGQLWDVNRIDVTAQQGTWERWTVRADEPQAFHIEGVMFQIRNVNGAMLFPETEAGKIPFGLTDKWSCLFISVSLPGRTSRSTSTVRRWKWRTVAR